MTAVRKATTIRVDPVLSERLHRLSLMTDRSINELANEALRDLVERLSLKIEQDLESRLEALRASRQADPGFRRGIAAFAKAEVVLKHDPMEGRRITAPTAEQKKALGIEDA